ncbi:hypothetical protein EC968_008505 [Mortierella alpina]|nr:hypothetical protein EC968_008505 [Mortierella alpina]
MRRSHPSLRKPPPLPRDPLLASHAGQDNSIKPWTTFSDLHRRHTNSDYRGQTSTSNVTEEAGSKTGSGHLPGNGSTPLKFCFGSSSTRYQQERDKASQDSLPDMDELFEDKHSPPGSQRSTKRPKRRQTSPKNECATKALDHNSAIERSPSQDDFMEAWLLSDAIDHSLRSSSPTPVDDNPMLPRSRSIASNTPFDLDEINKFLTDVSPALSPPSLPQIAGEQGMNITGKKQQLNNNDTGEDHMARQEMEGPCAHEPDRAPQSPQAPSKFAVPMTAEQFTERLQELRVEFQQELDNMLKSVREVNSLRREVKAALSSRKATLNDRGNVIRRQAKGLQHEAASLYTKGKSELNPKDKALA